nr:MAG TPA: hypothetical protein [Caudoviricetes sp.]
MSSCKIGQDCALHDALAGAFQGFTSFFSQISSFTAVSIFLVIG